MARRWLTRQLVLAEEPAAVEVERGGAAWPVYFGDLHNHTGYSDGHGRPEEALAQMRTRGLDFAAITDHAELLAVPYAAREGISPEQVARSESPPPGRTAWEDLAVQAAAATATDFLALRGFEFTSTVQGHVSVWGSADFVDADRLGHERLAPLWRWLAAAIPAAGALLAGLNHPGAQPGVFENLRYRPELEPRLATMELFNRATDYFPQYLRALERGWHLGAIGVSDHHGRNWGSAALAVCGLLARTLTWEGVSEALQARRVYATRERGLALAYTADGAWLGSRLTPPAGRALTLEIAVEAAPGGSPLQRLQVWAGPADVPGQVPTAPLAVRDLGGARQATWALEVVPPPGRESWYLVRVLAHDRALAYSTPIWACPA
jgi:hypothetical protein